MRFLDTDIFLRYVTGGGEHPANRARAEACLALFLDVRAGRTEVTTSEAVIAEVLYVLTSPRQYGLPPGEAAERLRPVLELRGLRLPEKQRHLRALDLLARYPFLGFKDALTVVHLGRSDVTGLLSYDGHFDRIPGVRRHEPDPPPPQPEPPPNGS